MESLLKQHGTFEWSFTHVMTRNVLAPALAVIVALCAGSSVAHPAIAPQSRAVETVLVIPDTRVLPGVPFDMWIDLHNRSTTTVTVGLCACLLVQPEHGQQFTVEPGKDSGDSTRGFPVVLPGFRSYSSIWMLDLAPDQRQTLTIPAIVSLGYEVFHDDRLSGPGRYAISVRLSLCPWRASPATYGGPVVTNGVTIERLTTTALDTAVWHRIAELAAIDLEDSPFPNEGDWRSRPRVSRPLSGWMTWLLEYRGCVDEILDRYRDSQYIPYMLLGPQEGPPELWLERLLDVTSRFPSSPVIEYLRHDLSLLAANVARELPDSDRRAELLAVATDEQARVARSARPTTRMFAFGREDLDAPAPHEDDEEDQ